MNSGRTGVAKDPLNLNLTSSETDAERKARAENYRKKIEEIKNAQVLGIKHKDGTSYSLVKYFSTTSEDNGIVKVYDVATKEYCNFCVEDIEIIA